MINSSQNQSKVSGGILSIKTFTNIQISRIFKKQLIIIGLLEKILKMEQLIQKIYQFIKDYVYMHTLSKQSMGIILWRHLPYFGLKIIKSIMLG